ncbi:hypothetical protein H8U31_001366 [Salmonella enterica]|nr:hypothetical protein [Salmonella enterica]EGC0267615.1 hypothetical protein [Salmonella enterica]
MQLPCKKRYIVGVVVIIFLLWKCSGSDDDEYAAQQRAEQAADNARYQANQDAIAQGQPQPYANAPQQPVIIQQQPERDHFWDYVMLHHLFNSNNHQTVYQPRTRSVTNVRNVTNVTNVTRSTSPTYTAKTTRQAPVKQPSSNWNQPSVTARSYTVSAPKPSSMQNKTWSTSTSKGWGSSSSYKPSSTSYKSSSSRTSFSSRGRR